MSNGFCSQFPVWKNHGKPGDNREILLADEAVKFIAQHKDRSASLEYWSFQAHYPWQAGD